jgi:hypothetical protein
MEARILPREEYARLAGTEAEKVWPYLRETDRVVVVERDGEIVGCHVLMQMWHLECLWKKPGAGTGVSRTLWRFVQQTALAMGVPRCWTSALDDRTRGLLAHVGAEPLPGTHYVVPMRG